MREALERTQRDVEREERIVQQTKTLGSFLRVMRERAEELEWVLRACEAMPEEGGQ